MKKYFIPFILFSIIACDKVEITDSSIISRDITPSEVTTSENPLDYITDPAKVSMLTTLTRPFDGLQNTDNVLEMNYTVPYCLDEALTSISNLNTLVGFLDKCLFDKPIVAKSNISFDSGCSAFAASTSSGERLMGRNFDYMHKTASGVDPITALVVKTPRTSTNYATISVVDSYWVGYKKGFYTDNTSDLSLLMAAPYLLMDGMNDQGLAIGVLKLDGQAALQTDSTKFTIYTTVAMRYILDRCSTVSQAIDFLKKYNINMTSDITCSMHFYVADASGDYAVIEYVNKDPNESHPDQMVVTHLPQVTNFYVGLDTPDSPNISGYGWTSDHGRARYDILDNTLTKNNGILSVKESMNALKSVSQGPDAGFDTSNTQWSSVYNLTNKTLDVAFLRDYDHVLRYSL